MTTESKPLSPKGLDPSKKEEFLQTARERVELAYTYWSKNHENARSKLAFLYGDQWNQEDQARRATAGRPALTMNLLPQFVDQIIGSQAQNEQNIHVIPASTTVAGIDQSLDQKMTNTKGMELKRSEVYEGIIREIEYKSDAMSHYQRGFQHAVESGFGWLRVYTEYEEDMSFDQVMRIRSLKDRFSCLLDPAATELMLNDARWGFIFDEILTDDADIEYPDATWGEFGFATSGFSWGTAKTRKIAEYFYQVPEKKKIMQMVHDQLGVKVVSEDDLYDDDDNLHKEWADWAINAEKTVTTHKWKWCKITSRDILDEPEDWAGSMIPIVPVLGKEISSGDSGSSIYAPATQQAEDPQRVHNFMASSSVERVANCSMAPWLASDAAIEDYEEIWDQANSGNVSVLPYVEGTEKPSRDQGATVPQAEMALMQASEQSVQRSVGMFESSVGAQGNEKSGRAVLARKNQSDTGTYKFSANFQSAIAQVGRVCADLIPKIFDGERVIRMMKADGEGDWIKVNAMTPAEVPEGQPQPTEEEMQYEMVNDLTVGKFDIMVKSGPGYLSQRMEMVESMLQFIKDFPEARQAVGDLIASNMDWPGADIISERLKKMVPRNMLSKEEIEEMGDDEVPPSPEQELMAKIAEFEQQAEQLKAQQKEIQLGIEQEKTKQKEIDLEVAKTEEQPDIAALVAAEVEKRIPAPARPQSRG